jgi:hypothetical protein
MSHAERAENTDLAQSTPRSQRRDGGAISVSALGDLCAKSVFSAPSARGITVSGE